MTSATLDITNRRDFRAVINDDPGRMNGLTLCFQTNGRSFYSLMMVASLFGDILENTDCQSAVDIVIQDHHLEWRHEVSLDTNLSHLLLFALTAL